MKAPQRSVAAAWRPRHFSDDFVTRGRSAASPTRHHRHRARRLEWGAIFRVLVVDDDADINESVRAGLVMAGFDAVGAPTGGAALAEIERRAPDLVLLDQMLPDIDGVEICRRLRAAPARI